MTKKILALLIAALMVCSAFAGCTQDAVDTSTPDSTAPVETTPESAPEEEGQLPRPEGYDVKAELAAYDDVMTLSTYYDLTAKVQPNNYFHDWVLENFKIDLQPTYTAGENYDEKVRTLAASSQLPDVLMSFKRTLFDDLSSNGLLLELDDLLTNYAPNCNRWYPAELRDMMRDAEGKLYTLVGYNLPVGDTEYRSIYYGGLNGFQIFTVNQDILAKTGMQAPKTVDEMIAYLQAATALDNDGKKVGGLIMDGFGPAGYSNAGYPGAGTGATSNVNAGAVRNTILHMLEQRPDSYTMELDDANQVAKFPYDFAGYPKFLKLMSRLYREKLLDQETFVQTQEQAEEKLKLGNNAMAAFIMNMEQVNVALAEKTNLPYAPVDFPVDPSVTKLNMVTVSPNGGWYWAINKNVADPERIAKYIEWHYSDEGLMFDNYGPPDESKTRNTWWYEAGEAPGGLNLPGKPVLDLELQQKWDAEKPGWESEECGTWGSNSFGLRMSMNYTKPGEFGVNMASDFMQDMNNATGHDKNVYYVENLDMVRFDAAPYGEVLKQKGTIVNDLLNKWEVRIIMQAKDDAEVDALYAEMMQEAVAAGYTDIAKEAYQIYNQVNA